MAATTDTDRIVEDEVCQERGQGPLLTNIKIVALTTALLGFFAGVGTAYFSLSPDMETPPPTGVTPEVMAIGTGAVTGVYFPTGGAICRLVNASDAALGEDAEAADKVYCAAQSTNGSMANLAALSTGRLPFAIVQSDWQYHAYKGSMRFAEDGPIAGLRSVFSIYKEPLTLVTRRGTGITSIADLEGKRVNIGAPGTGQRATMEHVMRAFGWTLDDFAAATQLGLAEQFGALCSEKTDAVVLVTGHPNGLIRDAIAACDAVLVSVAGPQIDQLLVENPYYARALIPGGTYPGRPDAIASFGVAATLVTSNRISQETIYALVRAVFENLDEFKTMHPAFLGLTHEAMIRDGLTAPQHEGAIRYFREQGWM